MSLDKEYRSDLPPIPERIKKLPIARGYPVPWFVAWIDGKPEFRVADPEKLMLAIEQKRCWVCGQRLDKFYSFLIGPMCSVNLVSAEPPCHEECAVFSAIACPFLLGKQPERRENDLPVLAPEVGHMIRRNPGCMAVWTTASHKIEKVKNGLLFRLGNPAKVAWYSKGRKATRDEVIESMRTGMPALVALCKTQDDFDELRRARDKADQWLPKT